jgi:hypothetical protein
MFKAHLMSKILSALLLLAMSGQTAFAQSRVRAPALDIPQERWVSYSEEALSEMRGILKKAMQMLADARKSNDAVRLNCVNEKVTSMKGILRVSEDADLALQEHMAMNAIDKAKKELAKIRIGRTKLKEALTGANTCSGSEASYVGATTVEVEMDPVTKNPASSVEYKATSDGNVVAVQTKETAVTGAASSGDAAGQGDEGERSGSTSDSTLNESASTGGIAGSSGAAGSSSSSDDGSGGGTTSSSPGSLNNTNQAGNVSNN